MEDNAWADIERKWSDLAKACVEAIQVASRRDFAEKAKQQIEDDKRWWPHWAQRWYELYPENPTRANDLLVDHTLDSVLALAQREGLPDLMRVAMVVISYRRRISATSLNIDNRAFTEELPDRPGMGSAQAIGTILCTWEFDGDRWRPPVRRKKLFGQSTQADPMAAGHRWLSRLRKRLNNSGDEFARSQEGEIVADLLKLIPSNRGRPGQAHLN